jgi:hypothetical protein
MADSVTFKEVDVATSGQTEGRLVFYEGKLIAIITKLDESHDEFQGKWFADAFFNGLEHMQHETFESLEDVARWIAERMQKG